MTHRRSFLAGAMLMPFGVRAQQSGAYPQKPVKIVVPYAAGSLTDATLRVITPKLGQILGAVIVVENKPGASGMIGSEQVARSPADGYTLLMGAVTSHSTLPVLVKNLSYNVQRDFTPIGLAAAPPAFLAVHPSVPAANLQEFIAWAKTQPAGVSYTSSGNGSSGHLTAELLSMKAGVRLVQVPYNNAGQAIADLIAGHAKMMIYYSPLLPHIRSGKLKGLAVLAEERASFAKDIPTASEQGFPGMISSGWTGLFAPAGLPPPIQDKLNAALNEALKDPTVKQQLAEQGQETIPMTPSNFSKFVAAETAKWGEVVRVSGAKLD